jgi:predicted nucleic acid-binding Zn ribbon protein
MPLYTYKCTQCDFSDEIMIPVKKRDKKFPCEQEESFGSLRNRCTGVMERDVDIPSFQLKGGGWAKDGYGKKQKVKKEEKKE